MTPTDTTLPKGVRVLDDECFEDNVPPMKRMRPEQNKDNDINSFGETKYPASQLAAIQQHSKLRANRFLRMHLVILKALYCDAEGSSTPFMEDSAVEDDDWNCIDEFLRERDRIQTISSTVEHMGSIHKEAVKFQHTLDGWDPSLAMTVTVPITTSPATGRTIASGRLTPSNRMYRSSLMIITQASASRTSPLQARCHQVVRDRTHSRALLWTSTTPVNRFYHPEVTTLQNGRNRGTGKEEEGCSNDEESGGGDNAFGIISGLLKRKHQIARKHLSKKSAPYRSLLLSIHSRIQDLEVRLKEHAEMLDKEGVDNDSFMPDYIAAKERADESRARMETKINLWWVLLNELKIATK